VNGELLPIHGYFMKVFKRVTHRRRPYEIAAIHPHSFADIWTRWLRIRTQGDP